MDHQEREEIILKISSFSKSKQYKEINLKNLEEVVNIVENPNLLHVSFNKDYLEIQSKLYILLWRNIKYFDLDNRDRLTNFLL